MRARKPPPLRAVQTAALVISLCGCREAAPNRTDVPTVITASQSSPSRQATRALASAGASAFAASSTTARTDELMISDPRDQAWQDLIMAADSDMHRPIDASVEEGGEVAKQYAKISAVARGRDAPNNPSSAVEEVAYALANAGSSETLEAVGRWILNQRAKPKHRISALATLQMSSRVYSPQLVTMYGSILSDELWASTIVDNAGRTGLPIGATWIQCSGYCAALCSLSHIYVNGARTLIERIAKDLSRTGPNPKTLAALTCDGEKRDEFVAQGLASERLIALALLQDKVLLKTVAADPTEPLFLRKWTKIILSGTSYWKRPKNVLHDDGPDPNYAAPCRERWYN